MSSGGQGNKNEVRGEKSLGTFWGAHQNVRGGGRVDK